MMYTKCVVMKEQRLLPAQEAIQLNRLDLESITGETAWFSELVSQCEKQIDRNEILIYQVLRFLEGSENHGDVQADSDV